MRTIIVLALLVPSLVLAEDAAERQAREIRQQQEQDHAQRRRAEWTRRQEADQEESMELQRREVELLERQEERAARDDNTVTPYRGLSSLTDRD